MSTDFLFARPTFLSGVARAFDWWGSYHCYNISRTGEEADVQALVTDWLTVHAHIRAALETVLSEDPTLATELERLLRSHPHDHLTDAQVPEEQTTAR